MLSADFEPARSKGVASGPLPRLYVSACVWVCDDPRWRRCSRSRRRSPPPSISFSFSFSCSLGLSVSRSLARSLGFSLSPSPSLSSSNRYATFGDLVSEQKCPDYRPASGVVSYDYRVSNNGAMFPIANTYFCELGESRLSSR